MQEGKGWEGWEIFGRVVWLYDWGEFGKFDFMKFIIIYYRRVNVEQVIMELFECRIKKKKIEYKGKERKRGIFYI